MKRKRNFPLSTFHFPLSLWQNVRYALRIMRKKPAFAIFAIVTIALGIAVNTIVFSIANAILLRPIPANNPDELIRIYQKTAEGAVQSRLSYPDYVDIRDRNSLLTGIAAVSLTPFRLEAGDESQQILGESVSGNYFSVLGVQTLQGRTISKGDDISGSRSVAVISNQFWRQRLGADPNATGKTIRLNGKVHEVIGVMSPNFTGTFAGARIDAWVPLLASEPAMMGNWRQDRARPAVQLLGRLKPNVSIEQADAELASIYAQLEKAYPDTNRGKRIFSATATLLHGSLRKGASIFFGAVMALMGVVLLIACSNLASLLVTKAMERRREMAIRISLGAGRAQLMLQLFTESLILAALGGLTGLAIAVWASDLIVAFWPIPTVPINFDFGPDTKVFLFCLGLTLVTAIFLGLAPTLQSSKQNVVTDLKEQSNVSLFGKMRLKNVLLVAQISLSLLLLICAALFVRSWQNAEQMNPGFQPKNMLAMDIDLSDRGYTTEQGLIYYEQLLQRVQSMPGVVSVGYSDLAPVDLATARTAVRIAGHPPPAGQSALLVSSNRISPGYFSTLQIPLVRGRDFATQDDANSAPAVIINETMAKRYWPEEDPIGKSFQIDDAMKTTTIIGIAKDARYRTPGEEPTPHIYVSYRQFYEPGLTLLVRTQSSPKSLLIPIEKEMATIDSNVQAFFARTMEEHLQFSYLPSRLGGSLLGFLGLLGVVLACIGIYAAISFQVAQRKREIGIRMAIGAKPRAILQLFVQRGLKLGLTGCAIGVVAAFAGTRLLSSLLIGVDSHDPVIFALVPLILMTVSFIACALPAYCASKLDPLRSLRYE